MNKTKALLSIIILLILVGGYVMMQNTQEVSPERELPARLEVEDEPTGLPEFVEYGDYSCSHCKSFHTGPYQVLKEKYFDTGKVAFIWKDFPVVQQAPDIYFVHQAPYCAKEQGKWEEMHDRIFREENELTEGKIISFGEELGLPDLESYQQCLEERRYDFRIRSNEKTGFDKGFTGTPAFEIGDRKITGDQELSFFEQVIEEELLLK